MTKNNLRNALGVFLIVAHFGVIFSVLLLWIFGKGFDVDEMIDGISIMAPMFAVYSTAILAHLLRERPSTENDSLQVPGARLFVSFFIPAVFIAALVIIITAWVERKMDLQHFKVTLGLAETFFGAYVGTVMRSLFRFDEHP